MEVERRRAEQKRFSARYTWCKGETTASTPGAILSSVRLPTPAFLWTLGCLHLETLQDLVRPCRCWHTCPGVWTPPLQVLPSNWSVNPTGQLQWTPVDVSLQVRSQPPLFTAHVSANDTARVCSGTLKWHQETSWDTRHSPKLTAVLTFSPEHTSNC